jgi:hypothetical protein
MFFASVCYNTPTSLPSHFLIGLLRAIFSRCEKLPGIFLAIKNQERKQLKERK